MKIPYDKQDVLEVVCFIVAEVVGCDHEEVQWNSKLGDDLDADSLSFVEIVYSLEKRFGINLPKKSIIDHAVEQTGSEELFITPSGEVTEKGIFLLEKSFFNFQPGDLKPGMKRYGLMGMTTPENWASSCYHMLQQLPHVCPDCGHDTAAASPNHTMFCAGCGSVLKPREGDAVLAGFVRVLIDDIDELAAA